MSEKQELKYTAWNKVEREKLNDKIAGDDYGDKLMGGFSSKRGDMCRSITTTTNS
jgi:hypothetical protein